VWVGGVVRERESELTRDLVQRVNPLHDHLSLHPPKIQLFKFPGLMKLGYPRINARPLKKAPNHFVPRPISTTRDSHISICLLQCRICGSTESHGEDTLSQQLSWSWYVSLYTLRVPPCWQSTMAQSGQKPRSSSRESHSK